LAVISADVIDQLRQLFGCLRRDGAHKCAPTPVICPWRHRITSWEGVPVKPGTDS
jgi:hypothetical protein